MKRLTDIVSEGFIWSVGITRPKPGQQRRAAFFITGTLVLTLLMTVALFLFILHRM